MLKFVVKDESVRGVNAYFRQMRDRVVSAALKGMLEAMQGLARNTVAKKSEVGIQSRSGNLDAAIVKSARASMSGDIIRGKVSGYSDGKPLSLWLGEGTHVPAVADKLMVFVLPDGKTVFTRKHREFSTPARPFMNPSLNEYKAEIVATINRHMLEALRK
jgi:hypothetical protein